MAFSVTLELQKAFSEVSHPESVSLETLRTIVSRVIIDKCVSNYLEGKSGIEWFSHLDSAIAFDLVPSALSSIQAAEKTAAASEGPEIGLISSPTSADGSSTRYNITELLKPGNTETMDKMIDFVHSMAEDTELVSSSQMSSELYKSRRHSGSSSSRTGDMAGHSLTAVEELTVELEQANATIRELNEYIEDIAKPALKRVEELDQDLATVSHERDHHEQLLEERNKLIIDERARFTESISQISEMIQIRQENPEIAEAAEDSIIALGRQATIFEEDESGGEFGTPSLSAFKASLSEMDRSESAALRRLSQRLTFQPLSAGSRGSLKRSSIDSSSSAGFSDDKEPLTAEITALIPVADFKALQEENNSLRLLSDSYKAEIDDLHNTLEDLGQELAATKEDLTFAVQQCAEASTLINELTNDKTVLVFELETMSKELEKAMELSSAPVIRRGTGNGIAGLSGGGMHARGVMSGTSGDFPFGIHMPSQSDLPGVPEMSDRHSEKSATVSPTGAVQNHGRYWDSGKMSDFMGLVSPTGRPYTPVSPGSAMSPRRTRPSALMDRLSSRGLITLDENGEVLAYTPSAARRATLTDGGSVSSIGSDYLGEEEKETPVPVQIRVDLAELKLRRDVGSIGSGDEIMPVIPEGAVSSQTNCPFCDQIRQDMEILVNDKLKLQTMNADLQFKCDQLSGVKPDNIMVDDKKENQSLTDWDHTGEPHDYNNDNDEMVRLLAHTDSDSKKNNQTEGFCCNNFQGW